MNDDIGMFLVHRLSRLLTLLYLSYNTNIQMQYKYAVTVHAVCFICCMCVLCVLVCFMCFSVFYVVLCDIITKNI